MDKWPKALVPTSGPMRQDKLAGAAEGMGVWGEQLQSLAASGVVQPDVMTALTLFILGNQPRDPLKKQKIPGAGGGVAGGVWVRERFTIHRPLQQDDVFTVTGEAIGRHVHKGRRYGTNASKTLNSQGELVGSNLTTGLLAYKVEEGLSDSLEGQSPDDVEAVGPDWDVAANNPCKDKIESLRVGDAFGGYEVLVGLDLMEARDTKNPDNPIHSDPELAKKAGLAKPIAGGAHVLSFPLEVVMAAAGRDALLHGAAFDIRWKAPVYADLTIIPNARVAQVEADRVVFEIDAVIVGGAVAMVGTVTIPLPRTAA
ncbi:MAG: hypothetical protein GKR90_22840 [Pseudomonadales bacterium]|nr:hypothetical protein [Pseudomonadales bacterium]